MTDNAYLILATLVIVAAFVRAEARHSQLRVDALRTYSALTAFVNQYTTPQERQEIKDLGAILWPVVLKRVPGIEAALLAEKPIEGLVNWLAKQGVALPQVAAAVEKGWAQGDLAAVAAPNTPEPIPVAVASPAPAPNNP